jgi:hypothetical protein
MAQKYKKRQKLERKRDEEDEELANLCSFEILCCIL